MREQALERRGDPCDGCGAELGMANGHVVGVYWAEGPRLAEYHLCRACHVARFPDRPIGTIAPGPSLGPPPPF